MGVGISELKHSRRAVNIAVLRKFKLLRVPIGDDLFKKGSLQQEGGGL